MKRNGKQAPSGWAPGSQAQGWMPMGKRVHLTGAPAPPVSPVQPRRMEVPALSRRMGQTAAPFAPTPPSTIKKTPVPEKPEIIPGKCPGAIEMPNGRTIEPNDSLTLKDFCELLPFLTEAMRLQERVSKGFSPGQSVPLKGMPTRQGAMPITAPGQFGPAAGVGGTGGGGGGGGFGGGGGRGQAGTQGPAGPPGPAGTTTPGYIGHTLKTDGDFSAGPGGFIPVPSTQLSFSLKKEGTVVFFVNAVLGAGAVIGIRVGGTDYELSPGNHVFPVHLNPGDYQAEIVIRGGTVSATTATPLALVGIHG